MKDNMYSPNATEAWSTLESLATSMGNCTIQDFFNSETNRANRMTLKVDELLLDYSKNLVSNEVFQQLLALAEQSNLKAHRSAMFAGEVINTTEDRAVLHAALRAEPEDTTSPESGIRNQLVKAQLEQVRLVSEKIRDGQWLGSTGKIITDVINIGIGGSDCSRKSGRV